MAKHSPAPWKLSQSIVNEIVDNEGNLVACTTMNCKREKANLNLIAAAPDLLEAAEKLLSEIDTASNYGDMSVEEARRLRRVVKPAIAKAKGERGND